MNIWKVLHDKFLQHKNRMSICNPEGKFLSYGELITKTVALSELILENTSQSSRIAVLNSHSYYDALGVLAGLAAGSIVVPISLKYGESHCCHIINNIEPDLILSDYKVLPDTVVSKIEEKNIQVLPFSDVDSSESKVKHWHSANDIALIMSTSGTTGIPKGVLLSHENILSNIMDIAEYFKLNFDDHILIVRPLYHVAVMTGEFMVALMSGCKITFYNEEFSPRRLLGFMDRIGCSTMCGTPTLFYHLGMHRRNVELSHLKKIVVSGERLLPEVADKLIDAFPGIDFFNVYGLTEASPRVSYLEPKYFRSKVGSVGIPLRSVNIKIVDKSGKQLPVNEIGEVIVQGPNVMQGYWREKEKTEKKIKDSWLFTGDLGYFDEEGFLYIVGRKDHMIIRAGMNIYPQEIENMLLQDDSIKEIMVWGEPDPKYGQKICVAMALVDSCDINKINILKNCRGRLQPYQWPDEVYLTDKLPRNASGKLVRGRPSNLKKWE